MTEALPKQIELFINKDSSSRFLQKRVMSKAFFARMTVEYLCTCHGEQKKEVMGFYDSADVWTQEWLRI